VKLSDGEKLILIMLTEIYEHLGIEDGVKPKFVREAIYSGNAWGLKWQYPAIFDAVEMSDAVRSEVVNILDMWSMIEDGFRDLSDADRERVKQEAALRNDVRFYGFDKNNEFDHLNAADFLINHLDRFSAFKGRELNSHMPTIDMYRRMYTLFEPLRIKIGQRNKGLSATEIIELLNAR
jgi:uncharacterized protein YfbU (UPF0304 family)